ALDDLDVSLDEAAESLGAGRLTVLRRVTLPLLGPRLVTTALVVFALALGDFANPFLLAGGP
ncbi:MAG TPA: iron ABC transporter permease, partial [Candidatus Rokubacteria bacterium]|nr:iron ABC transporter permease [Candidatus Rokubacteria bacterium]